MSLHAGTSDGILNVVMCSMQLKTQSEGMTIFTLQFCSIIYVGHFTEMRFTLMQNK
jgi:hypothetical protein